MTRPATLFAVTVAVAVGYFFGWVLPQCMDKIVSGFLRSDLGSRQW
jgi:lipopolysaccharide export LptBFGC system permease protein LptF